MNSLEAVQGDFLALPDLLRTRAAECPEAVYVEDVHGARLTYAQTDQLADAWGAAFLSLGVERAETVMTMLPPHLQAVAIWVGLARIGAIDVATSPELIGALLQDRISDCGARVMVTTSDLVENVLSVVGSRPTLSHIVVLDGAVGMAPTAHPVTILTAADALERGRETPAWARTASARHHTACVIYTSGTTGPAKGVLVSWGQLDANCRGSLELYRDGDAYYSPLPMNHASGRFPYLFMALCGGRVVLRERFSVSAFWSDIRRYGCTTTSMPGTIAAMLLRQPVGAADSAPTLRFVTMIPLVSELAEFKLRFGVEVRTMYNQTELSSPISSVGTDLADRRSCGRLRPGYEARLVDDYDDEVGPGEIGELILRTNRPWTFMSGYLGRPEATADAWRNGWLHTGDLFRVNEAGDFYYVDRKKDSIRRRGENISSAELERLALSYPEVAEAAAVAVPSDLGEDEVLLVVVPRVPDLHPAALAEYLSGIAPRYMVPRYIEFVSELPKTAAMQRVQKNLLRERGLGPGTWDAEGQG